MLRKRRTVLVGVLLVTLSAWWAATRPAKVLSKNTGGDIAITVDDLPGWGQPQSNTALMKALREKHKKLGAAPIAFFINPGRVQTPEERDALKSLANDGHFAVNHGFQHLSRNVLSDTDFEANVTNAESVLDKHWPKTQRVRGFRYPNLEYGDTREKFESGQNILNKLGLQTVTVSVDGRDYDFEHKYVQALSADDFVSALNIKTKFIESFRSALIEDSAAAEAEAGRKIPHILMLHLTNITVDSWGEILDVLKDHKFQAKSLLSVLEDPIYQNAPNCVYSKMILLNQQLSCSRKAN